MTPKPTIPTIRQHYKLAFLTGKALSGLIPDTLANLAGQYADAMLAEDERHASKSNSTRGQQ